MITNKQRAFLSSMANGIEPVYQCGKNSLTPEFIEGIDAVLEKRELIKVSVLKNCMDDPHEIAQTLSERTKSDVVRVIGKKIVDLLHRADCCAQRAAVVVAVERVEEGTILADQSCFGCGRACIDAQKTVSGILLKRSCFNVVLILTVTERVIIFL